MSPALIQQLHSGACSVDEHKSVTKDKSKAWQGKIITSFSTLLPANFSRQSTFFKTKYSQLFSEAYLEPSRTSMMELFCESFHKISLS